MIAGTEQQELDFAVHGDAGDVVPQPRVELRDLFRHQPVDVAVPVPDGAPRPVVGRLRLHAEVLHGGVGLRDDLDLVPFFPEGGHDLARQVGFPGARIARQQQASAFEAVEHGVFRDLPVHRAAVRTLGLDSGDPVLALEALDLLAPIHGRAVGMPFADQAVHEALELFGQLLEDDAVRLHGLQVPRRHGGQCIPDAADRDVLRGHHEVVHGPTAPVGQQLGHVDVVPVHPARGVQEQLPVLAAGAVELVVAGAHGVDEVHVARPDPDDGVHRQLRVVLLSPPARPPPSAAGPGSRTPGPRAPWRPGSTQSRSRSRCPFQACRPSRAWRTSPRPRRGGAGRSPGARPPGASRRSGPPGAPRGLAPRRWVPGTCCGPGRSCGTGPRLFRSRSAPACGC